MRSLTFYNNLLHLFLNCGLRRSELMNLKIDDFNDANILFISNKNSNATSNDERQEKLAMAKYTYENVKKL